MQAYKMPFTASTICTKCAVQIFREKNHSGVEGAFAPHAHKLARVCISAPFGILGCFIHIRMKDSLSHYENSADRSSKAVQPIIPQTWRYTVDSTVADMFFARMG